MEPRKEGERLCKCTRHRRPVNTLAQQIAGSDVLTKGAQRPMKAKTGPWTRPRRRGPTDINGPKDQRRSMIQTCTPLFDSPRHTHVPNLTILTNNIECSSSAESSGLLPVTNTETSPLHTNRSQERRRSSEARRSRNALI